VAASTFGSSLTPRSRNRSSAPLDGAVAAKIVHAGRHGGTLLFPLACLLVLSPLFS